MTRQDNPAGENCNPPGDTKPTPMPPTSTCEPPPRPPIKTCEPKCDCPSTTPPTETCFDGLIAQQAIELNKADHAKAFKAELEDLLRKANAAKLAYSRGKYEDFKKRWQNEDDGVAAAIDAVTCNVKCWWCLIECEICPIVYGIKSLDTEINGDGMLIGQVHSLLDLQYWHQRNKDAKSAQFERFKAVLAAWNNPADTIEKALVANDKIIKTIRQLDPVDAVLQLFLKVIPLHMAIAPRPIATNIADKYLKVCDCDTGTPDNCCGPDVGVLSVREQQLVGPQAYIIDPDAYMDILCCLVTERYLPAKEQLAKAASDLTAINDEITRKKAELERRRKSILEDALRNIVKPLDCKKYKPKDGNGDCGCDPKPTPPPKTYDPPYGGQNPTPSYS
ncbi:hypothetical protein [Rhizobium sp. WYJ-E13]|uniref:hypothetical protein n=1 Tax=Rhizobium sp. WYJ-E13 TaxID=2849093 RepID=UPI001C1ED9F2|nr:hypothetical protein [Rhizobium sp. WYJ-E13]QWW71220.1 hypothetical protein KQ933_31195 [Rhizobium sp. WYJ-E13]